MTTHNNIKWMATLPGGAGADGTYGTDRIRFLGHLGELLM
jgi:hypothetical protein